LRSSAKWLQEEDVNYHVIEGAFALDFAGSSPKAMVIEPESKTRLAFGPFSVDFAAEELRRGGVRIRLSGQPFQILHILLTRPGEVVTRDQLREQIWKDGTFVDFEHGLNAAINKLRRALGDSAENPRFVETVPGRGYRFIGVLEQIPTVAAAPVVVPNAVEEKVVAVRHKSIWWWVAGAAVVAVAFVLGWTIHKTPEPTRPWNLTRLTSDPGLSDNPAISRDGALVAYSSDRNQEGQRDLYLIQAAGGQPIRLTFDGEGNTTPDFSPDGSQIVYHSDKDGGGIYVIPTFGGERQLVVHGGLNPKFAPDGSQVAYWVGGGTVDPTIPGNGTVWVVPVNGGRPRQLAANLTNARYPIWSEDGQSLLLTGYTSQKAYQADALDWWLVSADGNRAVKTGAYDAFVRSGLAGEQIGDVSPGFGTPMQLQAACWLGGDTVIFYESRTDLRSLWETAVSSIGKVSGVFKRLTEGAGNEMEPSCSTPDRIVFTNSDIRRNIWSVPFDLNRGATSGSLERITETPSRQEHASLSADGRSVAFASMQAGKMNIWVRELADGKEMRLASMPLAQRFPVSNAAGTKVVFSVFEQDGTRTLYLTNPSGSAEKICDGCFRATDWSRDESALLVFEGVPYEISSLDLASHKRTTILKSANSLIYARYSPDNRWISFTERLKAGRARIMIAPVNGTNLIPESEWIEVADARPDDWAIWSSDGRTLYFPSAKDGHSCFWGQRLDPDSHRPVGEPFAVLHLHGHLTYQQAGWSAAGGRLVLVATEDTGNIWIMSRAKPETSTKKNPLSHP
jgi:Tol biopolymer transport system component/DNA-binding winged helix-turn-helix (wHTH) protein